MSDAKEAEMSVAEQEKVQFSLRVVINKQKTKVLFAEVDSNFADVLLSFLTLPLGTIMKALKNKPNGSQQPTIGSLTSLYSALENLETDYFQTYSCKEMLLNPTSSFKAECRKLKLDISDAQLTKYFMCTNWVCAYSTDPLHISMQYDIARCICGKRLRSEIGLEDKAPAYDFDDDDDDDGGVFTRSKASFLISDDLVMVPNVAGSVMETLKTIGVTDMDGAELRTVTFGYNEIMDLLKGSLLSRAPLSEIILSKRWKALATSPRVLLQHETENEATNSNSNKKLMILKVMVQKSTNKLLFAQAEHDFIDYLFSLLSIPLGGVERLLRGKTCLNNIDNLYRSLENINGDKFLRTKDTKSRLTNPKLPHGCMSENLILPLSEEIPPKLYYHFDIDAGKKWLSCSVEGSERTRRAEFTRVQGNYVKEGPTMYMVTDDLAVTPLCMSSVFNVLDGQKISLSDVEEVEVQIGLQEGLSILKASLTSTSALSNGLGINPMSRKKLKREQ